MTVFREQVALALRAVRVTSATSYTWFGRPSQPLDRAVRCALTATVARRLLVQRLQARLYGSFYQPGMPVAQRPRSAAVVGPDQAFVEALSSANGSIGGWGLGWRVAEVAEDGEIVARRDGLRLRMQASDYRPADGGALTPGALLSVRLPREQRAAAPGFYFAHGNAVPSVDPAAVEVRVYFNLTRLGAVPLVAAVTRLFNEQSIAFSVKVVDHPGRFCQCDAGVLYLREGDFEAARSSLRAVVAACAPHLRPQTPALTRRLAAGVAVGEHQAALGASFGIGRCHLVAEGIVDAYEQRLLALPDRVDAVARCFALRGLDLDRPYLVTNAGDRYAL